MNWKISRVASTAGAKLKRHVSRIVTLGCLFIGPQLAVAQDVEPSRDELAKQIAALQARVQELEARQQAQVSSARVDEVVERVLRDADSRSKFNGGISWSPGKLLIQSA